jgi:hypothetical protein
MSQEAPYHRSRAWKIPRLHELESLDVKPYRDELYHKLQLISLAARGMKKAAVRVGVRKITFHRWVYYLSVPRGKKQVEAVDREYAIAVEELILRKKLRARKEAGMKKRKNARSTDNQENERVD